MSELLEKHDNLDNKKDKSDEDSRNKKVSSSNASIENVKSNFQDQMKKILDRGGSRFFLPLGVAKCYSYQKT